MMVLNACAKFYVHWSNGSACRVQTDRHTYRHTHTDATENITSSANAGGNQIFTNRAFRAILFRHTSFNVDNGNYYLTTIDQAQNIYFNLLLIMITRRVLMPPCSSEPPRWHATILNITVFINGEKKKIGILVTIINSVDIIMSLFIKLFCNSTFF